MFYDVKLWNCKKVILLSKWLFLIIVMLKYVLLDVNLKLNILIISFYLVDINLFKIKYLKRFIIKIK